VFPYVRVFPPIAAEMGAVLSRGVPSKEKFPHGFGGLDKK
jgi:hypothetical protein